MDIEKQLIIYFKEEVGADVDVNTALVEENVIDSMGVMELIAYMEETFGIELDLDDLTIENFETIAAIKTLMSQKLEMV